MQRYILGAAAAALLASGAAAQAAQAGSHNPALKDSDPAHVAMSAHGANSFSEHQAQGRISKAGYADVSKLVKDKNGVWRGTAMRGGQKVHVGLDYKGNVTTR